MAVNISKTKYVIFRPKGANYDINITGEIVFNDNEIGQPVDPDKVTVLERIHSGHPVHSNRSYKLLGVYLDEYLSFHEHVKHVCNKVAQSNFIINRAKNFLLCKSLRTLYFALVHSHLLYCQPIYNCTSGKNIAKLEKMQKNPLELSVRQNLMPIQKSSLLVTILCH
jgi:hypothetical protein